MYLYFFTFRMLFDCASTFFACFHECTCLNVFGPFSWVCKLYRSDCFSVLVPESCLVRMFVRTTGLSSMRRAFVVKIGRNHLLNLVDASIKTPN